MNIVFFCQSCGSRFEVAPNLAGKSGRCKHCSQMMTIPKPSELASMAAIPVVAPAFTLAPAGSEPEPEPVPRAAPARAARGSWIAAATSNVALAPLTADNVVLGRRFQAKPTPLDNFDDKDFKPYDLDKSTPRAAVVRGGPPVSGAKRRWRKELGGVQKFFRKLNETAYLVSVPFLMLILVGAVTKSRSLALVAATVVVLLCLVRLVTGLANLLVIPFREGIGVGIRFLIPPLTFFYMSKNWHKLEKPTRRIVGPAVTILAVLLAFSFLPSLRPPGEAGGSVVEKLRGGAGELRSEIESKVEKAKSGAPGLDLLKGSNRQDGPPGETAK